MAAAEQLGATPIVARPLKPGEKKGSKYSLEKFVYGERRANKCTVTECYYHWLAKCAWQFKAVLTVFSLVNCICYN